MAGMLDGKIAVVTGAGGGIGREIAIAMARAGAKVLINDIGASLAGEGQSATPAEETKRLIEEIDLRAGGIFRRGDICVKGFDVFRTRSLASDPHRD